MGIESVSLGTAITLGLMEGTLETACTTAFLMTHNRHRCTANCAFCPQARESHSPPDRLSRIAWPVFRSEEIINRLEESRHRFDRLCVQCVNYPGVLSDAIHIIKQLRRVVRAPISVCIQPVGREDMLRLKEAGATDMGIAMDAANEVLFDRVKGEQRGSNYSWNTHLRTLSEALEVFGRGHVTTHLIVGLGESETEAARFLLDMYQRGVSVGLFAFTPVVGTSMANTPQPAIDSYRRLQILRHLLANNRLRPGMLTFPDREDGKIQLKMTTADFKEVISSGRAFQTSGCVGCNRPFYNERPRGPIYNYPRPLNSTEIQEAVAQSGLVIDDGENPVY